MNKQQAVKLYKTKFWKDMTDESIVRFQLFEEKLCMPFGVFHKAMEKVLKRPIWTHEFGLNHKGLKKEFLKEEEPPTMKDIIELIPEDKRMVVIGGYQEVTPNPPPAPKISGKWGTKVP